MMAEPSFCLFRCGASPLAVPVEDVAELVETDAMVRMSGCPPRIAGLCPYHRQVVPVVSLEPEDERSHADGAQVRSGDRQAVLILHAAQGPWGIRIDREGTTVTRARPERHDPRRGGGDFVSVGVIHEGGIDFALLDPAETWRAVRELVVNWYAESGASPSSLPPPAAAVAAAVPFR